MYTIDYIKEYMVKTKKSMNKNIERLFNTTVAAMKKDSSNSKERTLLTTGDKEISLVESHINQIKGLKSHLTYDFIKS